METVCLTAAGKKPLAAFWCPVETNLPCEATTAMLCYYFPDNVRYEEPVVINIITGECFETDPEKPLIPLTNYPFIIGERKELPTG